MVKHIFEYYRILALRLNVALAWRYIEFTGMEAEDEIDVQHAGAEHFGAKEDLDPDTLERKDNKISFWGGFVKPSRKEAAVREDVDITVPLIVADLGRPFGHCMIDGEHRLWKAYIQGAERMPVYMLPPEVVYHICDEPGLVWNKSGKPNGKNADEYTVGELKERAKAIRKLAPLFERLRKEQYEAEREERKRLAAEKGAVAANG